MSDQRAPKRSVTVVGGGASGVLLAINLLREPGAGSVTLIEKRDRVGQGLAYSTSNPEHVLNVNAFGMSAFPEDREHFWTWLQSSGLTDMDDPLDFAPRFAYGDYLEALLAKAAGDNPGSLAVINAVCTDLHESAGGVEAMLDTGERIAADMAVIASGHEESQARGRGLAIPLFQVGETLPDPDATVMILGTGLSMVDTWLTLAGNGHRGPIRVVSRHGLLPLRHERIAPLTIEEADVPLGEDPRVFARWLRQLAQKTMAEGGDWRSVVDGLRPFNQRIWQAWSPRQRRRFLTHLRPIWNVHRHRLPPAVFDRLAQAVNSGALEIIPGHFLDVEASSGGATVTIRRRGRRESERVEVSRLYDCGGMALDIEKSANPLIAALVASGRVRPDPVRIGLDVKADCAIVGRDGAVSSRLFAMGPLTRGAFFEIEAIPDIRVQAQKLARRLLEPAMI